MYCFFARVMKSERHRGKPRNVCAATPGEPFRVPLFKKRAGRLEGKGFPFCFYVGMFLNHSFYLLREPTGMVVHGLP